MTIKNEHVEQFATFLRGQGKQAATVESYCRDARGFLEYLEENKLPVNDVDSGTLVYYQKHLLENEIEKENSVRRKVIGVRQFFRFLVQGSVLRDSPFDQVPIPPRDERLPKAVENEQIDLLLATARNYRPRLKALRDAAIVALLAMEGLKANEIIHMKTNDLMNQGPTTLLHIHGGKSRTISLDQESANAILAYLDERLHGQGQALPDDFSTRMFIAFKGRESALPLPLLTRHGLKFLIYELGEKAGMPHLNSEKLRHFAISFQLSKGKSAEEVMNHLGLRRLGNIAKHVLQKGASHA